jgi:hypothetical protein
VPNPLRGQRLALATNPTVVFLFRSRGPDYGTHSPFAA